MIVVADTAPVNYLVLIEQAELLPELYGEVFIPEAVFKELLSAHAPEQVRKWAEARPSWFRVKNVDLEALPETMETLDPGEREAIALARLLHADLLIIDDRAGRREARRWNLEVKRLGVHLTFDERSGIHFQWVGVIDPEADRLEQKRHCNSQPDHRQLHKCRCSGSQDESQGGHQQSAPKRGKELQVGHPQTRGTC